MSPAALALLLPFAAAFLATAVVRLVARKLDFVSRPRASRWSKRIVPLGGGIGIFVGCVVGLGLCGWETLIEVGPPLTLMFVLGLIDDIRGVPPAGKLVVQAMAASAIVSFGCWLPAPAPVIAIPLTVAWIVGLTNSVNFLDNMDGLAAGVVAIAAAAFALLSGEPQAAATLLALSVAGAASGFLLHNAPPARIFMGDAGSLPLGFLCAVLATRVRPSPELPWHAGFLVCLGLLAIPLFDTALVSLARRRARRSFLLGGRDHSSHRLVALGFSERRAVFALWLLAALAATAVLLSVRAGPAAATLTVAVVAIALALLGVFLVEIAVYPVEGPSGEEIAAPEAPSAGLYALELFIDITVIAAVWTFAHYLRFQDAGPGVFQDYLRITVVPMLPYLISVKIGVLFLLGLHRGIWRSISIDDVFRIFVAASLGTLLIVLQSSFADRLQNLSRMVLVLDWMGTFLAVLATRAAIRAFRRWSTSLSSRVHRVALVGPPELRSVTAAAIAREPRLELVGVIAATEPSTPGDVMGTVEALEELVEEHELGLLLLAVELPEGLARRLVARGVVLRRARLEFD